jgi:hypothetical protein
LAGATQRLRPGRAAVSRARAKEDFPRLTKLHARVIGAAAPKSYAAP